MQGYGTRRSPTGHERDVARSFALSYDRLDPGDPRDKLAISVFARAAWFAPGEPLPRTPLEASMPDADEAPEVGSFPFMDALHRLEELGLLEEEAQGATRLHRLLAAFGRGLEQAETAREAVEQSILDLAWRVNNGGDPRPLLAWQIHLRHATDRALGRRDELSAGLANTLGYHLRMLGDYTGARPYYEAALAIHREVLGEKHPDTAVSLNNLGALLQAQGDYSGARPYFEAALAIDRAVLGEKHPDTAIDLNNLGMLLHAQGDYTGAQPYLEEALAILEAALGPEHPHTKTVRVNLDDLLARLEEGQTGS